MDTENLGREHHRLPILQMGLLIMVVLVSRCAASILTPLWMDMLDRNNTHNNNCTTHSYANIEHIDAYTTMFIVNTLFVALFGILLVFRYCTHQITEREKSYPKSDFVMIGVSDTLAGICFVYASSGCRTAPYLQALVANFSVPITFVVRFCLLRKRPTKRKSVCALLVIFAEFMALIPSIFPELQSQQATAEVGGAKGLGGVLWPLCFGLGFVPLAIVSTVIEKSVKRQGGGSACSAGDTSTELNVVYVLFWCYLFSLLTLIALCWTDIIPNFGMTSGPVEFVKVFWFNIQCYLGAVPECQGDNFIILVTLLCTVSLVAMRVSNTYFLRYLEGANYLVIISSMQTPLVFLFFTLFDENPFKWHPHVYLSTWLSIAALCIMLPAVYIYDTGAPEMVAGGMDSSSYDSTFLPEDDPRQPLLGPVIPTNNSVSTTHESLHTSLPD